MGMWRGIAYRPSGDDDLAITALRQSISEEHPPLVCGSAIDEHVQQSLRASSGPSISTHAQTSAHLGQRPRRGIGDAVGLHSPGMQAHDAPDKEIPARAR